MGNMCKEECESRLKIQMSRLAIDEKRSSVLANRRIAKSGQVYILSSRGNKHEGNQG
jgi:hypothetical protein